MFLRASNKLFLRLADKSVKALNTGSASKLLRWSSSEPIQPKQPDSQEELQYELDKQFLQYQQKLNMIRREACSYTPRAAEIEEFPHPFFIGKVGVRLSDIKFYRLKSEPLEAAQASGNKSVNYPKASWMRLLFPLESKPEMR